MEYDSRCVYASTLLFTATTTTPQDNLHNLWGSNIHTNERNFFFGEKERRKGLLLHCVVNFLFTTVLLRWSEELSRRIGLICLIKTYRKLSVKTKQEKISHVVGIKPLMHCIFNHDIKLLSFFPFKPSSWSTVV